MARDKVTGLLRNKASTKAKYGVDMAFVAYEMSNNTWNDKYSAKPHPEILVSQQMSYRCGRPFQSGKIPKG